MTIAGIATINADGTQKIVLIFFSLALVKIDFEASENTIKIVLPIFENNKNLKEDEQVIYKFLSKNMLKSMKSYPLYHLENQRQRIC